MGVFPVSATHHAARTPPTPATNLKLNAGASRRRRPPPRSCSPAPIPRRNDARRDALSGETPPPEGSSRPAVVLLSAEDVAERPLDAVLAHPLLLRRRNAWGRRRERERKLDGKALAAVELRGARAPLFHWYVRRRLPFDGQLRQNVVETDVRSTRPVMLP